MNECMRNEKEKNCHHDLQKNVQDDNILETLNPCIVFPLNPICEIILLFLLF